MTIITGVAACYMACSLTAHADVVMTLNATYRRVGMVKHRVRPQRVTMTMCAIIITHDMCCRLTCSIGAVMTGKTICRDCRVINTCTQPTRGRCMTCGAVIIARHVRRSLTRSYHIIVTLHAVYGSVSVIEYGACPQGVAVAVGAVIVANNVIG